MNSRAQIVATLGPASEHPDILRSMIEGQMDIARLNFAWRDAPNGKECIVFVRKTAALSKRTIPIIADIPGPRIQLEKGHTYDSAAPFSITPGDEAVIAMCAEEGVEYIALSFVGNASDVEQCRSVIKKYSGSQKIIAKIERKIAVENLEAIVAAADAIMVARGDLGNEIPLEEIPFVQKVIVASANAAGKPVIVATQMMLSMTENNEPTRAEVTDVEEAIMQGADAVMLSEESASGKYPVEAVAMMERIVVAAEAHRGEKTLHALHAAGTLIIARHHESEWNKEGKWTGTRDVHLTQYGFTKSGEMGALIADTHIDFAFASMQVRSIETLSCMLTTLQLYDIPAEYVHALNERSYGDYTGKNKWEMEKQIGEEAFESMRRDWDYPVPNGETLKMVYERVVPFYKTVVLPLLTAGRNVLLVSHGNALRALMMYLESIPPEKAREVQMLFGAVVLYKVDEEGKMLRKEVRQTESEVNA